MLTCKEITELATEYAEGALDEATSRSFEGHLAGCDGCQAWVSQLRVAARAVGSLPPPELPAGLSDELQRRFAGWQAGRASGPAARPAATAREGTGRRALIAPAVLAGATALLVALARHPSHQLADWAIGLGLVATAMALAAALRRLTVGFVVAAVSAALVAALLRGAEGPLAALNGLECLFFEVAMAAGMTVVAWRVARRGPGALVRSSLGAWAVAGALAADAALQVGCAQHGSRPHLLVFHAGGVLVLAAAAWLLTRPKRDPA